MRSERLSCGSSLGRAMTPTMGRPDRNRNTIDFFLAAGLDGLRFCPYIILMTTQQRTNLIATLTRHMELAEKLATELRSEGLYGRARMEREAAENLRAQIEALRG